MYFFRAKRYCIMTDKAIRCIALFCRFSDLIFSVIMSVIWIKRAKAKFLYLVTFFFFS